MVILHTNYGDITIELDHTHTPATADNFIKYVEGGHYDGTIFHRVMNGFMIQGGGFDIDMHQKKTHDAIKNEAKTCQPNKRGTIAMARTADPHSATAQFFINVVDNDFLDFKSESPNGWGYCVFGKVTEGMDVVDKIKLAPTTTKHGHQNVPVEDIVIEKATIADNPSE